MTTEANYFPAGFESAIGGIALAAQKQKPVKEGRPSMLSPILAALKVGKVLPLKFASATNASYGRHAAALSKLAIAKDGKGLVGYQLPGGVNTYCRALAGYRKLMISGQVFGPTEAAAAQQAKAIAKATDAKKAAVKAKAAKVAVKAKQSKATKRKSAAKSKAKKGSK
ncbi:hypothetical protein UFOVP119_37 [uncultured Caudovirales phage]|uniref:Uncharacterized protein n=1 Tax=uncultured Caudovirales phage TaxID=2100421 RepID=A0A6J5LAU7_9CAUD|nr:hypothetical protein UFOVP119_37 [uncultured Caudovirales phage]